MATNPGMAAALDRLWAKFLPEIQQRVALLETAKDALSAGGLSVEQRHAAHAAAHKLAGSLGTFGLQRGTELARQAEVFLESDETSPSALSELRACVAELHSLIENRK